MADELDFDVKEKQLQQKLPEWLPHLWSAIGVGGVTAKGFRQLSEVLKEVDDIFPWGGCPEEIKDFIKGAHQAKYDAIGNSCIVGGILIIIHSAHMLHEAIQRKETLKELAKETTGIKDQVAELDTKVNEVVAKTLRRIDSLATSTALKGPDFISKCDHMEKDIAKVADKVDKLLADVAQTVMKVKHEKEQAGVKATGAGVNAVAAVAFGVIPLLTPVGWGIAIGALCVNATAAGLAAGVLHVEIKNVAKCDQIISDLGKLEEELGAMKKTLKDVMKKIKALRKDPDGEEWSDSDSD